MEPSIMPAFAEGRYLAWEKTFPDQVFPVKGEFLKADCLLNSMEKANIFFNGPVVIARLAPHDYHRFHFVDSGKICYYYRIRGRLHSVNPIALSTKGDILCTNQRDVTIQETDNFGLIAYIEIGAMTVGKIIQSFHTGNHPSGIFPYRGEEKGYFQYGGSTVVLLGQGGRWTPDKEILECTKRRLETFVELGTSIAVAKRFNTELIIGRA